MKRKEVRGCIGGCACLSVLLLWSVTPALGQDDCATAVTAVCNGAGGVVDPCADTTPGAGLGSCTTGGGVLDMFIEFVATDTGARIRTDLNSAGTDSDYVVYQVDQADLCNQAAWKEIGCSEDEGAGFNGDITVVGLKAGDTYIVQLGSWGDSCTGGYTVDVACSPDGAPPEDQCQGRLTAVCNAPGVTGNNCAAFAGPNDPLLSCRDQVNAPQEDGGGTIFYEFVASDVSARVRTDLGFAATDSTYEVFQVNQAAPCDESAWVSIGCSEDDFPAGAPPYLGDINVCGLTPGDTYVIMLDSWDSDAFGINSCGDYTITVECPDPSGAFCGDDAVNCQPEECDGTDDAVCEVPASCQVDCTCPPPVCGNGIRFGVEECDGLDDDNCQVPGSCQADCTCPPPKVPALPVWGLIALGLLLFAGAAVVFGRGRTFTAPSGE